MMGLRGSSGPDHPEGLQKGEIRNMNSLVGKSTGIALLMAAALLAALFAMGVFAPTGVSAAITGAASVELSTPDPGEDVTITVVFRVNDDIDGIPENENVRITIPVDEDGVTSWSLQDGVTVPSVNRDAGRPNGWKSHC